MSGISSPSNEASPGFAPGKKASFSLFPQKSPSLAGSRALLGGSKCQVIALSGMFKIFSSSV